MTTQPGTLFTGPITCASLGGANAGSLYTNADGVIRSGGGGGGGGGGGTVPYTYNSSTSTVAFGGNSITTNSNVTANNLLSNNLFVSNTPTSAIYFPTDGTHGMQSYTAGPITGNYTITNGSATITGTLPMQRNRIGNINHLWIPNNTVTPITVPSNTTTTYTMTITLPASELPATATSFPGVIVVNSVSTVIVVNITNIVSIMGIAANTVLGLGGLMITYPMASSS